QVMQQIKGESSYWINKHNLCKARFSWQKDYYAISVNGHKIDRVRNYILNQEEHHKKATFKEEYDDFIEKYGFQHFF
ncbi:MAG: transposase, partial [Cyclobacteriaceae bacterium]|nr:transposase [Cyclobacteriaceae bacterium]